jgi:hypothetical protein
MIVVAATLLGFASVRLVGGRLARLARLDLRHLWIVWIAIIVQTVLFEVFAARIPEMVSQIIHLGTYALGFTFLILNRHIRGALVIGTGAALNALAIGANGGVMPASASAWRRAGLPDVAALKFENSNIVANPRLAFLGDIFAIPAGWPLANVFSIGDVVIVLGGTYLAHACCRRPITSNAWPAPDASQVETLEPGTGAASSEQIHQVA